MFALQLLHQNHGRYMYNYGERSHDEGDISTQFLRLSVDVFPIQIFNTLLFCSPYVTLRHHVDVKTSSALPYMADRAKVY